MVNLIASELARMVKAKRVGKGKWRAVCPVHGGRNSGPLSITDMPDGVRVYCFGGCAQRDILDALNLTWRDLKPDRKVDPEIVRQIRVAEELRKSQRERRTFLLWEARKRIDYWRRKSQVLGRSLAKWDGDKLAREFHYALAMERRCQHIWETL